MKQAEIQLVSGLSADTPLLIDEDVKSIRSLYLQTGVSPTFAFNDQICMINTRIQGIPKEIYLNDLYDISFSNGFHMTCTPSTCVLGINGYRHVDQMVVGEMVVGSIYNADGSIKLDTFTVDHVSKSYKMIAEPVYYFVSEHHNILLPQYSPENSIISFICVHQ